MADSFERTGTRFHFKGFSAAQRARFEDEIQNIRLDEAAPKTVTVEGAFLSPVVARPNGTYGGGVFDASGRHVDEARVFRHDSGMVLGGASAPADGGTAEELPEALYGGLLFGGYGHIILESLNRLWAAETLPQLPILVFGPTRKSVPVFEALAALLGVDRKRFVYVRESVRVRRLHVPEPGLELGASTNLNYVSFIRRKASEALRAFDTASLAPSRAVAYFSRAGLAVRQRRGYGERELERWLADRNVVVTRTEQLPLSAQMAIVNSFDRFAGLIGSQMHNLIFRYADRPLHVAYLSSGRPNANFFQIDLMFPGERLYSAVSSFEPLFEFGNRAPFHLVMEQAEEAVQWAAVGRTLELNDGAKLEDGESYLHAWMTNYLTEKVFRRWLLADPSAKERAEGWFETSWTRLLGRLPRPFTESEMAEVLSAFDESQRAIGLSQDPDAIAARAFIVRASTASQPADG